MPGLLVYSILSLCHGLLGGLFFVLHIKANMFYLEGAG